MPALYEQQRAFGKALVAGADGGFFAAFVEPPAVARCRFEAYRRNVLGNWRAALASTYPVLAQWVGPVRFRAIADAYIAAHGSVDGDLNAYGGALAFFLQVVGPATGPDVSGAAPRGGSFVTSAAPDADACLVDLARLEWALQRAYIAADGSPVDLAQLAQIPPQRQGEVVLHLWPGASLIESIWPVAAIWQAHRAADPVARDAALGRLDPGPGRFAALACRDATGSPVVFACSAGEAALWRALVAGATLADGIERALAVEADCAIGAVLPRWFAAALIVGFSLATQTRKEHP